MIKNSASEQNTIDYYNKHADSWTKQHGGSIGESYWAKEMLQFKKYLPSGKVLEIGSGPGKDATALITHGYQYVGTDASIGLISVAQKANPGATFLCQTVQNLDFPENTFDGFWTAATLLHVPKTQILTVLSSIGKCIKPNGIGFISLKQGSGEKHESRTKRLFSYYSVSEFSQFLNAANFEILKTDVRPEKTDTWLSFFVKVIKN